MNSISQAILWVLVICTPLTRACLPVRLAGDGRSTPSRDTTPPTIQCISSIHKIADPTAENVSVWWNEDSIIVADDSSDELMKTRTGQSPGQVFNEGTTTITYHARDTSGNFASCSFNITVEVIRCNHWDNLVDGWKLCNVGYDMRLGSVCEFGCNTGHMLVGPKTRECTISGEWDISTEPYCQKIQCPALTPAEDQAGLVNISCTDENNFGSICRYTCVDGYSLLSGHNTLQLCTENETWHGDLPKCSDTSLPEFTNCPAAVTGYAEASKTAGQVFWEPLSATDNSGQAVKVTQNSGPQSGEILPIGNYDVEYRAYDELNNTAVCWFRAIVKQISCPVLGDLPYTSIVCPDGRVLGSICNFSCEDGTLLQGQSSTMCIQKDTDIPLGDWDFQHQPYCEPIDICPALEKPKNGNLTCGTWELGNVCHMTCNEGYLVASDSSTDFDDVAVYNTVFVCGDDGYWSNNGSMPHCQEEDARASLDIRIGLQYNHVDNCSQLDNDTLHGYLMQTLKVAFQPVCQPPHCNVTDIQLIREDGRTLVGCPFELSVHLNPRMTSDVLAHLRSDMINISKDSQLYKYLAIDISGVEESPKDITVSQPEAVCEEGSGSEIRTSSCVKCNAGYFFDNGTKLCTACPKGYYQDLARQNECIQCPPNTTTAKTTASSLDQCSDACEAGFYSETGTLPCSACEVGSYSDAYGGTECTSCPRAETTLSHGAITDELCQDSDLVFPTSNIYSSSASVSVDLRNISTFSLSLWLQCSTCEKILTLAEGINHLVSVTNINTLVLQFHSSSFDTGIDISDNIWKKLTMSHTREDIYLYLDDHLVLHQQLNSPVTTNISSPATLTVGENDFTNPMKYPMNMTADNLGEGFQGSISQVHVWSYAHTPTHNVTSTCTPDVDGDIAHWGSFLQSEGLYVIADTTCYVNNNCSSSPCWNNGTCSDDVSGFVCTCLSGYIGIYCEVNINNCQGNACSNNGTCIDTVDGYACVCSESFTGDLCHLNVVQGGWTNWDISGSCSVSCGTGVQQRSRVCNNPVPSNGGAQCQGDSHEYIPCESNSVCINECAVKPTSVDYGDMNCEWTDNETHVCTPSCHEGYDFDNDIYLGSTAPVCSKYTGYTWNIRNNKNPYAQIPSCTAKSIALVNIMYYSARYDSLTTLDSTVQKNIKDVIHDTLQQTGCIQTGRCILEGTSVYLTDSAARRKRNSDSYVMFTSTVTCEPTHSINECYDLLVNVLSTLENDELTVQYNGVNYNVGTNTSTVDGTSRCIQGFIPVMHYCVPCGIGTYAMNNYCELCDQGFYQDESGQTSCKQCPDGFSTDGVMTRDRELCNVPIPESDDEINWQVFTVVILCAVIGILLAIAAVYIIWDRKFKKRIKIKNTYLDEPAEPGTPPILRFHMRNVWYLGKAVRKDRDKSFDSSEYSGVQNDSDLVYDVVEDISWNDQDKNSINLPETPMSYGVKSPPFRYSSPISTKQHAWK